MPTKTERFEKCYTYAKCLVLHFQWIYFCFCCFFSNKSYVINLVINLIYFLIQIHEIGVLKELNQETETELLDFRFFKDLLKSEKA